MQICCALPRQVLFTLETDFIDSPVSSSTYFCAIFSSCFNCVFWLSASNNLFLDAFSCSVSAWPDTLNAWIWDSSSAVFSVMVTICWSRWSISVTRRSCSDLSVWQTINIYIKLRPCKAILITRICSLVKIKSESLVVMPCFDALPFRNRRTNFGAIYAIVSKLRVV